MKKLLLVGDSPIGWSPYIMPYIELCKRNSIRYDFLFWNRYLEDTTTLPDNHIPYNRKTNNNWSKWKRLYGIFRFCNHASLFARKGRYDKIVVFTIAHALFMAPILLTRYKSKYVIDVRDYSPLLGISSINRLFDKLVANSAYTVLSSSGFKRWLPASDKYVISHNTSSEMLEYGLNNHITNKLI